MKGDESRQSQSSPGHGVDMTATTTCSITDTADYIGKLLDGSGASQYVDYADLGNKLEIIQKPNRSSLANEPGNNMVTSKSDSPIQPFILRNSITATPKTEVSQNADVSNQGLKSGMDTLSAATEFLTQETNAMNTQNGVLINRLIEPNRQLSRSKQQSMAANVLDDQLNGSESAPVSRRSILPESISVTKQMDQSAPAPQDLKIQTSRASTTKGATCFDGEINPEAASVVNMDGGAVPSNSKLDQNTDHQKGILSQTSQISSHGTNTANPVQSSGAIVNEIASLVDLSSYMVAHGLPPLPRSLETVSSTSLAIPGILTKAQGEDLRELLKCISDTLATQQFESNSGNSVTTLCAQLNDLKESNTLLRNQLDKTLKQASQSAREVDALKFHIQEMERHDAIIQQRDAQILKDLQRKYGRHYLQSVAKGGPADGLDNFVLEVIRGYESKIEKMLKVGGEATLGAQPMPSRPIYHPPDQSTLHSSDHWNPSRHTNTTLNNSDKDKTEDLKHQISNLTKLLSAANNEVETLKLQVLSTKKFSWMDETTHNSAEKKSTREMIRRDKLFRKSRLAHIEQLSADQARSLLNDVCVKLSIRQVEQLPSGIERIHVVLCLIGQMQSFIREVDAAVRLHTTDPNDSQDPKKLPELLSVILKWGENTTSANDLTYFSQEIHKILNIQHRYGSDSYCLEEIRQLVYSNSNNSQGKLNNMGDAESNPAYHFKNLFNVPTMSGVPSKINEVFVFCSEVGTRVDQFRAILKLDNHMQPGMVLTRAVDTLKEMMQKRARDSTTTPNILGVLHDQRPVSFQRSSKLQEPDESFSLSVLEPSEEFEVDPYTSGQFQAANPDHYTTLSPSKSHRDHQPVDEDGKWLEPRSSLSPDGNYLINNHRILPDSQNNQPVLSFAATPHTDTGVTRLGRTPRHADSPIDGLSRLVGSRIVDESI